MKKVLTAVAAVATLAAVAAEARTPNTPKSHNYAAFSITIENNGWFDVIVNAGDNLDSPQSIPLGQKKVFRLTDENADVSWKIQCGGQNKHTGSVADLRPHVVGAGYHDGQFYGTNDDDIRVTISGTCFGIGMEARQGDWVSAY